MRKITIVASLLFMPWIIFLPVYGLAIGFSGYELLNPINFIKDLIALNPHVVDRIISFFIVFYPLFVFFILINKFFKFIANK